MKKTRIAKLSVCLSLVLMSGALFAGCGAEAANSQSVYADQKTGTPAFIMAGKVEAVDGADVGTKISARISKINVDVGSVVNKGDLLAQFDMKEVPAQADQASAGLQAANVNLSSAKLNYDRIKKLYESGAASQQAYDSAKASLDSAAAQVAQAKASLNVVNSQLSNGQIVAPISGTVVTKSVNEGEIAVAGSTLFSIVNTDSVYINAYLPARLSEKVDAGQKVIVRISELPDKLLKGEVTTVDPVVDAQNKNILVKVKLLEDDPGLKVGMFAEIALDDKAGE